jgi:plasmid maintenance system antidote protein VapI
MSDTDTGSVFGNLVRHKRLDANMSCGDLAKAIGIHESHLREVELGQRPLSARHCLEFAKAVGVDSDAIVNAAQDFHRDFWSKQNMEVEVTTTVGHATTIGGNVAILRDELVRLVNDIDVGKEAMSGLIMASPDAPFQYLAAAESWTKQADAAIERAYRILAGK